MQNNPFDIPNMGFSQDNPLFNSMSMMRQMWEGMASNPMGLGTTATAMPSAEDLDKRIKELRAIENWLRLNLSMLTSTIQGLEIQRSTLSTFQSFAQSGLAVMPGLNEAMAQAAASVSAPAPASEEPSSTASSDETSASTENMGDTLAQAGQAWWSLMQQQFDTLAQTTAQSMQQTQAAAASASDSASKSATNKPKAASSAKAETAAALAAHQSSADTTFGKKTAKKAIKKTASKAAAKSKSVSKTNPSAE